MGTELPNTSKTTVWKIGKITDSMKELLTEKNKRYGDSALNPTRVFNKLNATESILIRLDDKLGRVKNNDSLRRNDIIDLTGYLILLMASKDWLEFKDLID